MKKRRTFLAAVGSVLATAIMFSMAAFATAPDTAADHTADRPMLYYSFGEDGAYKVSEAQFKEIITKNNLEDVALSDGLAPVPQMRNISSNKEN